MADKIVWQLGADASQVRAEMNSAMASVSKATATATGEFNKVDAAQGRATRSGRGLLESNNRVTSQFQGFTRTLLSARNATDVMVSGLDRLENSLNLSLAGGFALAGAAVVIQKIGEIQEAYRKLSREITAVHDSARADGKFKTISQLAEDAKAAESTIKQLSDTIKEREGKDIGLRIARDLADFVTTPKNGLRRDKTDPIELAQARADQSKLLLSGVDKRAARSDLKGDALAGTPDYEIKAREIQMAHDEANHAVHMMTQAAIELNLAFKELAKTVTDKHMERSGMSLSELANVPDVVPGGMSYERHKKGMDAKRALELERQAEAARAGDQPELAHSLFNEAGAIKDSLTNLKPSEKMAADLKGALVVTEQTLKEIAAKVTFKRGGVQ